MQEHDRKRKNHKPICHLKLSEFAIALVVLTTVLLLLSFGHLVVHAHLAETSKRT